MSLTFEDMIEVLGLDDDTEDATKNYVENLLSVAKISIANAVDSHVAIEKFESDERFEQAVSLLVSTWFFNRQDTTNFKAVSVNPWGVEMIINQLRGKNWDGEQDAT